jgi:hypothetical protein
METLILTGRIKNTDWSTENDGLRVGTEILSEYFEENLRRKYVTVRFYISDAEKSAAEMKENHILQMIGSVDADFGAHYSDLTGYLWTDDDLKIGNHDVIEFLREHDGKYLYMEIDVH